MTKEVQANMVCCQEHNLDTTQASIQRTLFDTVRQYWQRSRLVFGTTPETFVKNSYYPGGSLMLSTGNITGQVLSTSSDKWGRWSSQTYRGQHKLTITVISAYQVVINTPASSGIKTAASQQQSMSIKEQDPIVDPREAFKRDLFIYFLRLCITNGEDILLVGDFNEPLNSDVNGISAIAHDLQLIDLMQNKHSASPPATYARGRTCLDYGFATRRIAQSLARCGYEAFNKRYATDHSAYYFNFGTADLFGTENPTLANPATQVLKSNNVIQVTQYSKEKYEYLIQCKAFERAKRLTHPGSRHAFAERLDRDVLHASLAAEK